MPCGLLFVIILPSVKETCIHNAFSLFLVIHVLMCLSVVAIVTIIYVTDVRQVVMIMHVRLQTNPYHVPVLETLHALTVRKFSTDVTLLASVRCF